MRDLRDCLRSGLPAFDLGHGAVTFAFDKGYEKIAQGGPRSREWGKREAASPPGDLVEAGRRFAGRQETKELLHQKLLPPLSPRQRHTK